MAKTLSIPTRDKVALDDTWDLTKIYKTDAAWLRGYKKLEKMVDGFDQFRGKLGRSAKMIRNCCDFESEFEQLAEKVGVYAFLKSSEDVANGKYQGMVAQFSYVATVAGERASFIAPEIQAIPKPKMAAYMKSPLLAPYKFSLEQLLRFRPHILSNAEERILAMQGQVAGTASRVFSQLNDADLDFGTVVNEDGDTVELSQSSIRSLMESRKRSVRKTAHEQFYKEYDAHANTLAAALSGSVLQDVYNAKVRNFPSAREAALFSDNVPVAVYDNLVAQVRGHVDVLHQYLEIRKRALKVKELQPYDAAVNIVKTPKVNIPYDAAVETICEALRPLGKDYVNTLHKGLTAQRWVDRFENKGKRSGAFSYGTFGTPPYILMNYKNDTVESMFTLAHEAGHSMHSHYTWKEQPHQYASYTIFVAEVASTFNEQLLGKHLMEKAQTKTERAQLISKEIDEIRGTIIRQTMFAEFETVIHALAEAGEPLTLEVFRAEYRKLLEGYFGGAMVLPEHLDLEGLRVPHFYSAFYVYKYATGLSAAIALSRKVLDGGRVERDSYLNFLKSGGSKFPLDLLRDAGVNLEKPDAVGAAMDRFRELVTELDALI